ncbi:hypothetical protein [Rhodococcus sp. UNC363MFTsu5.1]|uniref:hypothetical protein n=1 Tax=Rhodococcus sp. UNC363MFTsu5.1 TaxID=1449069 RepID=UPI0012DE2956|nr:hypothetical protein [Rhodococcus sp. UNC363MFTsu5.1]
MSTEKSEPKSVFVISQIGSPGTEVHAEALLTLNYVIRKALPKPEWDVVRADEEASPDSIGQKVIDRVITSDLIVADLTGHNPNVFYELAVAHCFKKPVVLLNGDGKQIPFDITDQRAIRYTLSDPASVDAAQKNLLRSAIAALDKPEALVTPLTQYEAVQAISQKAADGDPSALADILENFGGRLAQIERNQRDQGQMLAASSAPSRPPLRLRNESARFLETDIDRLNFEIHSLRRQADSDRNTLTAEEYVALEADIKALKDRRSTLIRELKNEQGMTVDRVNVG